MPHRLFDPSVRERVASLFPLLSPPSPLLACSLFVISQPFSRDSVLCAVFPQFSSKPLNAQMGRVQKQSTCNVKSKKLLRSTVRSVRSTKNSFSSDKLTPSLDFISADRYLQNSFSLFFFCLEKYNKRLISYSHIVLVQESGMMHVFFFFFLVSH